MRRFNRDICACCTHCDADIGLRKRGRVIHAVADHHDNMSFCLKFLYDGNLVFRQKVCAVGNTQLFCECRCPLDVI